MDLDILEQKELVGMESFSRYCKQIRDIPYLTKEEEEQRLAYQYINDLDLNAAHTLIVSHLRYVVSIARKYAGYGLPLADLVQEGNIGLMKAVKRFDPSKGFRLATHALLWIKEEIANYIINNWRILKIATTHAQRKLFFNLRSMQQTFGTLPEDELAAIAAELNVKEAEVREMEVRIKHGQSVSLYHHDDDDEEDDTELLSILSTVKDEPTEVLQQIEQDLRRSIGLYQGLKQMDERSRRIVTARWLSDDDSATLATLSDEFNLSKERVRQIEISALAKLKTNMEYQ